MYGQISESTSPSDDANEQFSETAEQLASFSQRFQRMAEMVAIGDMPLPRNLTDEQLALLGREVQQRRRRRLVQFIARAIAIDIAAGHGLQHGG
jgi:hypothetical protein